MNAQVQLICMSPSLVITSVEKKHNEHLFHPFLARQRHAHQNAASPKANILKRRRNQLELVPWLLELLFYASSRDDQQRFVSYVETQHEVSIVFEEEYLSIFPDGTLEYETIRWKALQVASAGTGAFLTQLAVLQELTNQLAKHQISVFQISTYQTDYMLVKVEDLEKAIGCLQSFCDIEMESGETFDEWKASQQPQQYLAMTKEDDTTAAVSALHMDENQADDPEIPERDDSSPKSRQQHLLSVPNIDLYMIQIDKNCIQRHMYALVRLLFGQTRSDAFDNQENDDQEAAQGKLFLSYSETGDDISVVTSDSSFVDQMRQLAMQGDQGVIVSPDGWKVVQIGDKKLGFIETGIVAGQTRVLLNAGTMVFYLSTYATDFMMIKEDEWDSALASLRAHTNVLEGRFAPLTT